MGQSFTLTGVIMSFGIDVVDNLYQASCENVPSNPVPNCGFENGSTSWNLTDLDFPATPIGVVGNPLTQGNSSLRSGLNTTDQLSETVGAFGPSFTPTANIQSNSHLTFDYNLTWNNPENELYFRGFWVLVTNNTLTRFYGVDSIQPNITNGTEQQESKP